MKVNKNRTITDEVHLKVASCFEAFIKHHFNKSDFNTSKNGIDFLLSKYESDYLKATKLSSLEFKDRDYYTVKSPVINKEEKHARRVLSYDRINFLIESLKCEGYYKEKTIYSEDENAMFHSMIEKVYKGVYEKPNLKCGTYLLYRKTFNKYAKSDLCVLKIFIYEDESVTENGSSILRYKSFNSYEETISTDDNSGTITRFRESNGHVFSYQYNTLLFGSVNYSHIKSFDNINSQEMNNYPEMIMISDSGDHISASGITLSNYPYTRLPVATSIYLKKIKTENLDEYNVEEDKSIGSKCFGDADVDDVIKKYITNKIDELYSEMLSPR